MLVAGDFDHRRQIRILEKLREGYDLVMGNRFSGGIEPGAMPWKNRYIGNPALSGVGRLFFRSPVKDFHCGQRGFSLRAFQEMKLATRGMEYASEMVVKAVLNEMKITEVPITLSPDGRSRPPHLSPWRDGWRHLRFMALFSPRWLFLYPGVLLMTVCFLVSVWTWLGPQTVGRFTLDIHTLFYAAVGILIGFQAVSFYGLSHVFATRQGFITRANGIEKFLLKLEVEWVVISGILISSLGAIGLIGGVAQWGSSGFGGLDPRETMRDVIPAGLATSLGLNLVLNGLFMGMLKLPLRMDEHE